MLLQALGLAVVIALQTFSWVSTPETWLLDQGESLAKTQPLVQVVRNDTTPSEIYYLAKVSPEDPPQLSAENYGLVELHTGLWLASKNLKKPHAPASLTKLMTALIVFDEVSDLDEVAWVSRQATLAEGKKVDLVAGEKFTVKELLTFMLTASGNDAAVVLAEHVGGTVAKFVTLMNAKAVQLGMRNTTFKNPTGLDAKGHLSTVSDLSLLARFFWADAKRARYTQQAVVNLPGPGTRFAVRRFYSTNQLNTTDFDLWGAKTGTTDASGESLIYVSAKGELKSVAILLNSEDRFNEAHKLINWSYDYNFTD